MFFVAFEDSNNNKSLLCIQSYLRISCNNQTLGPMLNLPRSPVLTTNTCRIIAFLGWGCQRPRFENKTQTVASCAAKHLKIYCVNWLTSAEVQIINTAIWVLHHTLNCFRHVDIYLSKCPLFSVQLDANSFIRCRTVRSAILTTSSHAIQGNLHPII